MIVIPLRDLLGTVGRLKYHYEISLGIKVDCSSTEIF